MSEWISVKDRLPEDKQNCIIYHNLYEPYENCGVYKSEFKHWHNDDELGFDIIDELGHGVTHWMPMPEAPKRQMNEK